MGLKVKTASVQFIVAILRLIRPQIHFQAFMFGYKGISLEVPRIKTLGFCQGFFVLTTAPKNGKINYS